MSTPTGIEWAFPLQLRSMLAASANFRTWIGAADVSAASTAIGFAQEDNPAARVVGDRYGFIDVNQAGLAGVRESTGGGIEAFRLSSQTAGWGLEWRVEEFTDDNTIDFLNVASAVLDDIFDQPEARNVVEFRRFDPAAYPLRRMDGEVCRYQLAYALTARQGPN